MARRARIEERPIETGEFRTEADDTDDLVIRESSGRTAALTHWSFGQLTIAGAPPTYLRTLPAAIASSAINYGLQRQQRDEHQLFVERTAPRALRDAAGLTGLRFHDLRHTVVTRLLEAGEPDHVVESITGHLSRRMLEHYSHIRLAAKKQALDRLAVRGKAGQSGK